MASTAERLHLWVGPALRLGGRPFNSPEASGFGRKQPSHPESWRDLQLYVRTGIRSVPVLAKAEQLQQVDYQP